MTDQATPDRPAATDSPDRDAIQQRYDAAQHYDGNDRMEALGLVQMSADDVPKLLARVADLERSLSLSDEVNAAGDEVTQGLKALLDSYDIPAKGQGQHVAVRELVAGLEAERDRAQAALLAEHDRATDALAGAERLRERAAELEAERDRFRAHPVTLNGIGFRMAEALGRVPDGADAVTGDPDEQLTALIAERDKAVRERDSLARRCALRYEETEKLRAALVGMADAIGYDLADDEVAQQDAEGWAGLRMRLEEDAADLIAQRDKAEAERDTLRAQLAQIRPQPGTPDDLDALRLRIEQGQAERAVIEAAKAWRASWPVQAGDVSTYAQPIAEAVDALAAFEPAGSPTPEPEAAPDA